MAEVNAEHRKGANMRILDDLQRIIDRNSLYIRSGKDTIRISESGSVRVLSFNGTVYSRINLGSLYTREYWDMLMPLAYMAEKTDVLMIGLGGGTVAYQMKRLRGADVSIDVVEIDRAMAEAMTRFLPENLGIDIVIGDGADYVHAPRRRYDAVILDAYVNSLIPEQFFSRSFLEGAMASLKDRGVLALNYINSANTEQRLDEYVGLARDLFAVYELSTLHVTLNRILLFSKGMRKPEIVSRIVGAGLADSQEGRDVIAGYRKMHEFY